MRDEGDDFAEETSRTREVRFPRDDWERLVEKLANVEIPDGKGDLWASVIWGTSFAALMASINVTADRASGGALPMGQILLWLVLAVALAAAAVLVQRPLSTKRQQGGTTVQEVRVEMERIAQTYRALVGTREIVVIEANYGVDNLVEDVRNSLQAIIDEGIHQVVVSPSVLGVADRPGRHRSLMVSLQIGDLRFERNVPDGGVLVVEL